MRRTWRKLTLFLGVAIGVGLSAGAVWYGCEMRRDAEVVAWLRSHAVPLRTVDPFDELFDLQPLESIIGDARVVGAGEATHGTREHFLYKHRLLRFLVTRKGFRAIAFESPWPTGIALNNYVLGGEGDPARLLGSSVFGVWHTQEVLDMVTWMREYNAGVPREERVEFVGIDMQLTRDAASAVEQYLAAVDPKFLSRHAQTLRLLTEKEMEGLYLVFDGGEFRTRDTAETRMVSAAVREILRQFDAQRSDYIAASTAREFDIAQQHARILFQQADVCEDVNSDDRDRYMADNVDWYLTRHPGRKIMIWAHNGHVAFVPPPKAPDLGRFLKDRHGSNYVSLGFVLGSGAYRALDARRTPISQAKLATFSFEPRRGSFNALMKRTGLKLFAVDLRPTRGTNHPLATRTFRLREGYGVVVNRGRDPLATIKRSMPATFDILVFIEPTTPARRMPRAAR